MRHLAGRGKENPFEKGSFLSPCTPYPFPKLFMFAFSFCVSAKKKKRDISFENEEGLKGNARNCLYSRQGRVFAR
jgi:hypothetical protein